MSSIKGAHTVDRSKKQNTLTAEHGGEQSVEHALARQQRRVGQQLGGGRARRAHGPELAHAEAPLGALELDLDQLLVDRVAALRRDVADRAARTLLV